MVTAPKEPIDSYLRSIKRAIEVEYNFTAVVHYQYNQDGDKEVLVVWDNFVIRISMNKMGPARMMDFMDEFNLALREKYPEVLL